MMPTRINRRGKQSRGAVALTALLALAASGAWAQAPSSAAAPAAPVVTVGSQAFSLAQYRRALKELGAPLPDSLGPAARRAEAANFIRFERLLQAARRSGLDHSAAYRKELDGAAQKLLVRLYSGRLLARAQRVPAADINAYLRQHQAQFAKMSRQLARAKVSMILFHQRYRQAMTALRRERAHLDKAFFSAPKAASSAADPRR
ncbi:MAG: hypothetical protein ACRD17_01330 [Terriglobales bacterium]